MPCFLNSGSGCNLYWHNPDIDSGREVALTLPINSARTYVYPGIAPQYATEITKVLVKLNPACVANADTSGVLSVILPPSISIGDEPVDLKKIAFLLTMTNAANDLGLAQEYSFCCGNVSCCVNV